MATPAARAGTTSLRTSRPSRRAVIAVRNPATHDSRILREAKTLEELGYRPLILAVVSEDETARHSVVQGIPILRLAPSSPLAWIRSRLRRSDAPGDSEKPTGHLLDVDNPRNRRSTGGDEWPLRRFGVRLHRWLRTIDFYRRAIGVVRKMQPELVHCNDYNTMWVGVGARAGPATVIYDAHELWPDRNLRPEPRWWLIACEFIFVRCAHRTITASPGYAKVMARRYRVAPPQVIRNIPDSAPPAMGSTGPHSGTRPDESEAPADLVYVGALTRNRGLEISIKAVSRLPGVRLRLVGTVSDGYRAELLELARRERVEARVEFADPVPPNRVLSAINGAGVGLALIQPVCLSYRLCLPNKLFEYVAAGVPVLASDLPVIGEFVREHGVGLLALPDDEEDVTAKLSELLDPTRHRALRIAARNASRSLRWERESRLLAGIYREATAAAGNRIPG